MAAHPYRWTLEEFVLRCALYADIWELLVEGELDIGFYSDLLERRNIAGVTIRDSDYIHLTDDEVRAAGFSTGAKGRLLTVAAALREREAASEMAARVSVLVDRDYDGVPETLNTFAIHTDGYSTESYAINSRSVSRFIRDVLGRQPQPSGAGGRRRESRRSLTPNDLLGRVMPPSIEVAASRRLLRHLCAGVGLIDRWIDYVTVDSEGTMSTNSVELIHASLVAIGRSPEEVTDEMLAGFRAEVEADQFSLVRGHDYVCLLHKLLRSRWGRRVTPIRFDSVEEHHVRRWVVMSAHPGEVDGMPVAMKLAARFGA